MARREWFKNNDGSTRQIKSFDEMLMPTEAEIDVATKQYMQKYDSLKKAFRQKTKLTNYDIITNGYFKENLSSNYRKVFNRSILDEYNFEKLN